MKHVIVVVRARPVLAPSLATFRASLPLPVGVWRDDPLGIDPVRLRREAVGSATAPVAGGDVAADG